MYDFNHKALCGMKADSGFDRVESFPAAGDIPFGTVVTDDGGKVVAGGDGTVRGGAVHSHGIVTETYEEFDAVSVMTRGLMWLGVADGEDVTEDGPVEYDPATGYVGDAAGTAVPNAVFRSGVETSPTINVALVEFHNPFQ